MVQVMVRAFNRGGLSSSVGQSLLELMITVLLVCLLVGAAVPSFQAQQAKQARMAAQLALGEVMLRLAENPVNDDMALVMIDALNAINKDYVFRLFPRTLASDSGLWVLAQPRHDARFSGEGALSLTSAGEGCWHRGNDSPVVPNCVGDDERW